MLQELLDLHLLVLFPTADSPTDSSTVGNFLAALLVAGHLLTRQTVRFARYFLQACLPAPAKAVCSSNGRVPVVQARFSFPLLQKRQL